MRVSILIKNQHEDAEVIGVFNDHALAEAAMLKLEKEYFDSYSIVNMVMNDLSYIEEMIEAAYEYED